MTSDGVWFHVDPQPPRGLFALKGPFVLYQADSLLDTFCRQDGIAAEANEVEVLEAGVFGACAISPGEPLHIAIDSDQDRVVVQRRNADKLVRNAFRQDFTVVNDGMPVFGEGAANGIWNARIEE